MSVLIKGMEMPTSCGDCKAFVCYRQWAGDVGDCFCGITKNDAKAKEKNADCPLVHVPLHVNTNADRIRAMTDEELASYLTGVWYSFEELPGMCDVCDRNSVQNCSDCWLDWLKQEAAE